MLRIKQLAEQFRKAMDIASRKDCFKRIPCFSNFPDDCCDMTCDLLGCFLAENQIETYQINGRHFYDNQRRHSWLVTENGIIIDITGDQFNDKGLFDEHIEPVYVNKVESIVHKSFCVDKKIEENTAFTDESCFSGFEKMPNYRQKNLIELYDKINMFL